jgi:hypothetical protein
MFEPRNSQATARIDDLEIEDDASFALDDERDLHLTDSRAMQRIRSAGTTTSPGSSDEDN